MIGEIIGSALGFVGGLFDDDDNVNASKYSGVEAQKIASKYGARRTYPGQKTLAKELSSFLSENLDMGLTEKEKDVYRGAGKTSILQASKAASKKTSKFAASQGLRGGNIARILSDVEMSTLPQFTKLESGIAEQDISAKRQRINQILGFLALQGGWDDEELFESEKKTKQNNANIDPLNYQSTGWSTGVGGFDYGGDYGEGSSYYGGDYGGGSSYSGYGAGYGYSGYGGVGFGGYTF